VARAPVAVERQFSCGERPGNHALLDQATEYEPTTAGVASVEAERQRLKVGLEVDGIDRALVGAQESGVDTPPVPADRVSQEELTDYPPLFLIHRGHLSSLCYLILAGSIGGLGLSTGPEFSRSRDRL